jgi:hypothetical protein
MTRNPGLISSDAAVHGVIALSARVRPPDLDAFEENAQAALGLFEGLRDFDARRWLSICQGLGATPLLVVAGGYCRGFQWADFAPLIEEADWSLEPTSHAAVLAGLANPELTAPSHRLPARTAAFLLATRPPAEVAAYDPDVSPALDELSQVWVAWAWARQGFDDGKERALFQWAHGASARLRFWARLALILRKPELRAHVDDLNDDVEGERVRKIIYDALQLIKNTIPGGRRAMIFMAQRANDTLSSNMIMLYKIAPHICR